MTSTLALFFLLLVASPALAASELCEIVIDSKNPRRVDIRFPGKVITVVGHVHPRREDEELKFVGFERFLWTKFSRPDSIQNFKPTGREIKKYQKSDARSIQHWREDRATIEQAMRDGTHRNFSVEMQQSGLNYYTNYGTAIFQNIANTSKKLNLSAEETTDLQVTALTPSLYLRETNPALFGNSRVITVEPSDADAAAYDAEYCKDKAEPEGSGIADEKQTAIENIIASMKARGISQKTLDQAFNRIEKNLEKLMGGKSIEQLRAITSDEMLKVYARSFRMPLTRDELNNLKIFCSQDEKYKKSFATLDHDQIMANLPRFIEEYNVCWGRDALIARNLARQRKSTMLLIGIGHLAPQAALLKKECLRQTQSIKPIEPTNITR